MASSTQLIDSRNYAALNVPDRILASEWIPSHVRIPDQTESPGPFDLSLFPHAEAILEALDETEVEEIILIWSTRNGKTFTTLAAVPFWATQRSKPIGFASSDAKNLVDNVEKKLYPMLEATPATSSLIPPLHMRNIKEVSIGPVTVVLANAKSKNTLANFPAQLVIANEVGLWPMNSVQRLRQRLRNFKLSSKAIFEGKPEQVDLCTISRLANGTDVQRCVRYVPCPHCGTFQPLIWGWGRIGPGVKWNKGTGRSSEFEASSSAYYECVNGCHITSSERADMLRRGVWCPEGQHVEADGTIAGDALVPSRKRLAFIRLSALYSLMVPGWGAIVSEWFEVKHDKELVREFVTGTLAEAYDPKPKSRAYNEVASRLACSTPRGICPEWSKFLVMSVDCGMKDKINALEFFWQVQAWGMIDGKVRGHLVDFGYVFSVSDFVAFFGRVKYPHQSGGILRPAKTGIDFGDGQMSARIIALCQELNESQKGQGFKNRALPLKGDSRRDSVPGWYVHGYFDSRKDFELKMMKARGECDFITVRTQNSQSWREGLVSGVIERSDKDFFSLPAEFSADPEQYEGFLKELTADYRTEKGTWEENGANENGDLLRYGRALASVHTNHDKNWQRICNAAAPVAVEKKQEAEADNPFSMVGSGQLVSLLKGVLNG